LRYRRVLHFLYSPVNEVQTSIQEYCSEQERELIVRALIRYNDTRAQSEDYRDLFALARHNGELVGGLIGYTHWDWLFIKQLWVSEAFRRRGIGSNLLRAAEHESQDRGCLHAHCDTFDFQALPFYRVLGYRVFGRLDDYPAGHTRYFLQKRNLRTTGKA
jgi:ribosomal protein S18 acetylase RimI-like enzyme